jgi:phosphate-selective porin
MNLKTLKLLAICAISSLSLSAQLVEKVDTLNVLDQRVTLVEDALVSSKKLKISGYVQTQWQSAQLDSLQSTPSDLKVGGGLSDIEKRDKATEINRFGVRRGRVKFTYEDFGCQGVLQLDLTEKGLGVKDAYLNVMDPWLNYFSIKSGVFDRPFGYEITYSSSRRESPERSRIFQTLFPDERDFGTMLAIQAPKTSPWTVLRFEAGLFAGNGINTDNDSKKDFIGHLTYTNSTPKMKYAIGASYYNGSIAQLNKNIYKIEDGKFVTKAGDSTGFSKREYIGVEGQFSYSSLAGLTSIRAEYLFGMQPGSSASSGSPSSKGQFVGAGTAIGDTYIRSFQGGYVNLVQDIADTKHSIVVKYDWYDPNTKITGDKVGVAGSKTGKADMAYSTLGFGYLYRMNTNVRIMAYYDMVSNEATKVKGFFSDVNDNLVTVRVQYKF